jgi:hypothetical protein
VNRDALQRMRLDRRLIGRRGWIGKAELEREIEALPDVGSNATTLGQATDERERAGAATPGETGTAQ